MKEQENRQKAFCNMAWKINIMQAEINETEVVKDTRARSNICWGRGEIGHFYKDCRNPNK